MPLPAPDLDDRRFQELVDDAKRMVQQRCPEWTDHNVSDPGVTLIELFAWMTDQIIYRLNRVPDRNFVRFLDLLGVRLFPATPARTGLTFWLAGPIDQTVTIPQGTRASTAVSELDEPITFTTVRELAMPPCELISVKTGRAGGGERSDHSDLLQGAGPFHAFSDTPEPGDHVLFGLSDPLPWCAVELTLDARIEGVGVDPDNPPLAWEAWDGQGWVACEVESDGTGGLNRRGAVVVHLPADHEASVLDRQRAGWLRCRVVEAVEDQPAYSRSPEIVTASARTAGGTVPAVNAVEVTGEIVGLSEGVPGQRFELEHRPVLGGDGPLQVEIASGAGWDTWRQTDDFADAGPDDRVFRLDEQSGELAFGPAVRLEDGTLRQYGAVPPTGAPIRVPRYRTGGGRRGNVARGTITQLTTAIPYVASVTNRTAATGGVDTEDLDNAKKRGPLLLRTRNRAVTREDYEVLAREAAPEVARVRCVEARAGGDPGVARVLVVPHASGEGGRLHFDQLVPADETLQRIAGYLDERRPVGARLVVEPPVYQGITVVARLRARPQASVQRLHDGALAALYRYFHPLVGGPDGDGWPFGRPVHVGEVYAVLQGVDGVGYVEDARLFGADPISGERGGQADRLALDANALVFSYEHQALVEGA